MRYSLTDFGRNPLANVKLKPNELYGLVTDALSLPVARMTFISIRLAVSSKHAPCDYVLGEVGGVWEIYRRSILGPTEANIRCRRAGQWVVHRGNHADLQLTTVDRVAWLLHASNFNITLG